MNKETRDKEMVVGKIEQLSSSREFNLPEARLVDCLDKNHPLVVEYVKDLKEENQQLKEKLERTTNIAADQFQCDQNEKRELREKLEIAKKALRQVPHDLEIIQYGESALTAKDLIPLYKKVLKQINQE